MRRLAVWVEPAGFRARNVKDHVTGHWADVAAVEIDDSSLRSGRLTGQQAVYLVLRDGRRVELDALRVDGFQRSHRKRAALEPYRQLLTRAAR